MPRVTHTSEKFLREVEHTSAEVPAPDRITPTGKRIWYTGRNKEQGAGIYFGGAMGGDLVKIGWVQKMDLIEKRLDRMRIDCPFPVMLLLLVGPANRTNEKRLHKHFEEVHYNGEWFRYAGELREILERGATEPAGAAERVREIFSVRF